VCRHGSKIESALEDDGVGDFLGLTDSAHRNERGIAARVTSSHFGQERRLHRAGADRIHPDAPFGVLMRYEAASVERHLDLQRPSVELKPAGLETEKSHDMLSQFVACYDADALRPWATTNFLMRAI
jgi:hypothetical protein